MSTATLTGAGPTIACPSWCRITRADHLDDLRELEGSCVHYAPQRQVVGHEGHVFEIFVSRISHIDGTPDTADGPADLVYVAQQALTTDQAVRLATAILAAVEEARA